MDLSRGQQVLKTAYKAGMISDETLWLKALQERNNVTYSYNREIALEIVRLTKRNFTICSVH